MKIDSTSFGNYNVYSMQRAQKALQNTPAASTTSVTQEEKDFFATMYPEQKNDIINYHFYERSGKMSGVSVGSLFDRRM